MASFKVIIKQSVAKDLRRIPKKEIESILKRIEALAVEPRLLGAENCLGKGIIDSGKASIGSSMRSKMRNWS